MGTFNLETEKKEEMPSTVVALITMVNLVLVILKIVISLSGYHLLTGKIFPRLLQGIIIHFASITQVQPFILLGEETQVNWVLPPPFPLLDTLKINRWKSH